MTLRAKLVLAFTCVTVVLLVPTVFAVLRLGQLRDLAVDRRSGHAAAVTVIGRSHALVAELDRMERSFIATGDPMLGRAAVAAVDSLVAAAERLSTTGLTGDTDVRTAVDRAAVATRHVDRLMAEGRVDEATEAFGALIPAFREIQSELALAAEAVDAHADEDARRADATSRSATVQTLLGIGIALLLTLIVAIVTTRTLEPVRRLVRGMANVADGGFEPPAGLPYGRKDEIGELSNSFAIMALRLAEIDRTKAEFFGIVSHELKTPLNVIGAYAELLHDDLAGERSEHRRKLLHEIRNQCGVMLKRVCRLMDISRISAGTYELTPERVGTEEILTSLRKAWAQRAQDRGVTFTVRTIAAIPEFVVMDVDIIRDEVLGNLIVNALRFTPTGGVVDVEVSACEGGITFAVTDTGPGITEEHRELVFQKHYVIDRRSAVGSGLGLAIAKEMVELHGGFITLDPPHPDRGARFVVALPRYAASAELEMLGSGLAGPRLASPTEARKSTPPPLLARLREA